MAKVTITVEDKPNGHVKITVDPPVANLMQMVANRNVQLTAAEGYVLFAVRQMREESNNRKTQGLIVRIPRIGS